MRRVLIPHDSALSPLQKAAALGDLTGVQSALNAGDSVHLLDAVMGGTALHYGAQSGSAQVCQTLLDAGALPNVQAHSHGMTALMVAVWHRNPDVVATLLAHPAIDVDMRARTHAKAEELIGGGFARADAPNEDDEAIRAHFANWRARQPTLPLMQVLEDLGLPLEDKLAQITALLAEGANPNEIAGISNPANPGHTPLLVAAREGWQEIVQALLEAGADMTLVDGFMLAHPAHKAAYNGHADVMRVLVAHPDFAKIAEAQGPFNGYTALHDASWHGHADTAQVLREAGVDLTKRGYDGRTPAELATHSAHDDLADALSDASGV